MNLAVQAFSRPVFKICEQAEESDEEKIQENTGFANNLEKDFERMNLSVVENVIYDENDEFDENALYGGDIDIDLNDLEQTHEKEEDDDDQFQNLQNFDFDNVGAEDIEDEIAIDMENEDNQEEGGGDGQGDNGSDPENDAQDVQKDKFGLN